MTSVLKSAAKTGYKTLKKYGDEIMSIGGSAGMSAGTGGDAPTVIKDVAQSIAQEVAEKAIVQTASKTVASLGAKASASSAAGPIGWAVMIIQLTFAALDMLWNPFQSYYNKDLAQMKETIDVSIRKQFLENGLADLHKPFVDDVILVSASGKAMKRVPDLVDVWFDSGAMPYAQWHYPFENRELVESGNAFPADFIAEGVDQTRGWFYTLHAIATMVFGSLFWNKFIRC